MPFSQSPARGSLPPAMRAPDASVSPRRHAQAPFCDTNKLLAEQLLLSVEV